jgi:peptidase M28-like protein/PDZ domain-containing protein/PA domain-containing protein
MAGATLYAQSAAVQSNTRPHVVALAADRLEGRLTGTAGERQAGDYIAAQLKRIGARPLPGQKDYRLPFEFTAGSRDGGSRLSVVGSGISRTFDDRADVQALSFSDNGDVPNGAVVFAGYGIVVPESQDFGYDSYATLDVKDKVVVVLRYFPEDADQKTRGILARYADLRYKAMAARQRGAKAMLVVTGPRSPNAGLTIPMSFDTALSGSGIVAASISGTVGNRILAASGKTLEEAQKSFDSGNPHVAGFEIPGVTLTLRTAVVRERRTGYNIAGYLPSTTGPELQLEKPWIALGAHYDHLGHGENGNSLAVNNEAGRTHAGADDNASGSAAVLAVGEQFASQQRRRNVLLAFWSGEELGLIGSTAFINAPPIALNQIAAYFNFDMVGRMQDNKLTVQAAGTSPAWARAIEQANVAAGFDLLLQQDPYQPTDVASFNQAGVPSLNFFTGTHADYHKPSDTAEKINFEDLDRIVAFAANIARRVGESDEPPAFTKVEQQMQGGGGRAGVRVFTGTVPDYSTEVKGLLLSGVIAGGPAEQAGLQKGDVIVEIAGQTIANIYDYTYALDVLKIGEPAKVVYMRGDQRRETTLTPAARK